MNLGLDELKKYATEQIDDFKNRGVAVHDDLIKYQKNAMRKVIWEEVITQIDSIKQKHEET